MQGVADAVTLLAGSRAGNTAGSAPNAEQDCKLGEASRAACLEDEVLNYVAEEGAARFSLLSLVPKSRRVLNSATVARD